MVGTWCRARAVATASHVGSGASNDRRRTRARLPNRLSRRRAWASISGSMSMASTAPTRSWSSIASAKAPVPAHEVKHQGWANTSDFVGSPRQAFFVAWNERADGLVVGINSQGEDDGGRSGSSADRRFDLIRRLMVHRRSRAEASTAVTQSPQHHEKRTRTRPRTHDAHDLAGVSRGPLGRARRRRLLHWSRSGRHAA